VSGCCSVCTKYQSIVVSKPQVLLASISTHEVVTKNKPDVQVSFWFFMRNQHCFCSFMILNIILNLGADELIQLSRQITSSHSRCTSPASNCQTSRVHTRQQWQPTWRRSIIYQNLVAVSDDCAMKNGSTSSAICVSSHTILRSDLTSTQNEEISIVPLHFFGLFTLT